MDKLKTMDKLITIDDYNATGELFFENKTVIRQNVRRHNGRCCLR
jgi:hypothetical protein